MYYDLQKLSKDPNYYACMDKVKEVLMTDERLSLFLEQSEERMKEEASSTLIFENPAFMPFSFEVQGMMGKIDHTKKRYSFECHFTDLLRDSKGKV